MSFYDVCFSAADLEKHGDTCPPPRRTDGDLIIQRGGLEGCAGSGM